MRVDHNQAVPIAVYLIFIPCKQKTYWKITRKKIATHDFVLEVLNNSVSKSGPSIIVV